MSLQYGEIPAGGQVYIPPSIPSGILYRVKQIMGISKQTLKLESPLRPDSCIKWRQNSSSITSEFVS